MQPTASRAELLLNCVYPFSKERVLELYIPGDAALYGTAFHEAMADLLENGVEAAKVDPKLQTHVAGAHSRLIEWLAREHYLKACKRYVEVSLAYCPRSCTARNCEPPRPEDHIYPDLRDDEIGGTADLIVVPVDKTRPILVLDHKTGIWGDFSRPELLPQLQVLGTMACLRYGRPTFIAAVLHSPKDAIPIVYSSDEIGAAGYGNFTRFREQASRIGDGSLRPGPYCKTCPARSQCPAHSADLLNEAGQLVEKATLVGSELVLVANTNGQLTREEKVGRLHLLMSRFRELDRRATDEMKRALRDDRGFEPIRPDGKRLVLKTRRVERISKSSIVEALGKVEGEKMLEKLRKLGALEEKEEIVLWAE